MEVIDRIKRMKKLSDVLLKYGFEELFDRTGMERFIPNRLAKNSKRLENIRETSFPERIRLAMQDLGPTYVKLGQM